MICNGIGLLKKLGIIIKEYIINTNGELEIPVDALEMIVRCVLPDIIKYYEIKRSSENDNSSSLAHLTKEAV